MKAKQSSILLTAILVTLLLTVNVVHAGDYTVSFSYTQFNSTTETKKALDKEYKEWYAEYWNKLTYNTTTSNPLAIVGFINATSLPNWSIDIKFDKSGGFSVWLWDGSSATQIGTGTWNSSEPVVWTYDRDTGKLNVGDREDYGRFIEDYGLGDLGSNAKYVKCVGSHTGANYVATAGRVDVVIGKIPLGTTIGQVTSIVYVFIPCIIAIAVMGILLSMTKQKW